MNSNEPKACVHLLRGQLRNLYQQASLINEWKNAGSGSVVSRGAAKLNIAIMAFIKIVGTGSRLFRKTDCYNNMQQLNIFNEGRLYYEVIDDTIKTCAMKPGVLFRVGFKRRVLVMCNRIMEDDLWRYAQSKNGKNENRANLSYDKMFIQHIATRLQFTDFNKVVVIFLGKRKPIC